MKRRFYSVILGCLVMVFSLSKTVAQNVQQLGNLLPKIVPLSPNSASIEKYGNYEVSFFTGLPQIDIPLYNITVGGLELPISLSYHASGIRVNEVGSWVGLGWSLNAGYSISRQVRGLADELQYNYLSGNTPVKSTLNINTNSQTDITYMADVNRGRRDVEPDLFTFNIPGKSGRFLFNHKDSFKPIIVPFAPIDIIRNMTNSPYGMNLDILDESGTLYKFSDQESSVSGTEESTTSSWLISKMISPNKAEQIQFTYTSATTTQTDISDYQTIEDYGRVISQPPYGEQTWSNSYNNSNQSVVNTTTTQEKYINEILFTNGKVKFFSGIRDDRNQSAPSLSSIVVYHYDNLVDDYVPLKTIKLYQSNFIKNNDPETKRMKLDRIEIIDNGNNVIQNYSFEYNTNQLLPKRTSRGRDYWGYYNGLDNNTTLIPGQDVDYISTSGGNTTFHVGGSFIARDPNPTYMQANILKKITYPTGGYTEFSYETNKYKTAEGTEKYAGGLRVSSIKSYDSPTASPILKTYVYGTVENPNSGNGKELFILSGNFYKTEQTARYFFGQNVMPMGNCYGLAAKRVRTFISTSTLGLDPNDGSPVIYPVVTEYLGSVTANTGKTQYTFRYESDQIGPYAVTLSGKSHIYSFQFARGQLEKKLDYKIINGTESLVKSIENQYEAFPRNFYYDLGLIIYKKNDNITSNIPSVDIEDIGCQLYTDKDSYYYANYGITTGDNKLIKSTEKSYDSNQPSLFTTNVTNYFYADIIHQQLTKIDHINSNGKLFSRILRYPKDFSGTSPYNTMVTAGVHIINKVVEEEVQVNGSFLSLQRINYFNWGNNNLLPKSFEEKIGNNPIETRRIFNKYDNKGNLVEEQQPNGINTSYVWGYRGQYLIAEIKNATYDEVSIADVEFIDLYNYGKLESPVNFEYVIDETAPVGNIVVDMLSQIGFISTYGLNLISGKSYVLSYWEKGTELFPYSSSSQINVISNKIIKYKGSWKMREVIFNHIDGGLDFTFNDFGLLQDLKIYPLETVLTTYTYKPLVGMTSMTDAKGMTTYYEYDSFQRLKHVKDQNGNILKRTDYHYKN